MFNYEFKIKHECRCITIIFSYKHARYVYFELKYNILCTIITDPNAPMCSVIDDDQSCDRYYNNFISEQLSNRY